MQENEIKITTEFITLGQFLKIANFIHSGGEAKSYLSTHSALIDGMEDNRRGRKIYPGMKVVLEDKEFLIQKHGS